MTVRTSRDGERSILAITKFADAELVADQLAVPEFTIRRAKGRASAAVAVGHTPRP